LNIVFKKTNATRSMANEMEEMEDYENEEDEDILMNPSSSSSSSSSSFISESKNGCSKCRYKGCSECSRTSGKKRPASSSSFASSFYASSVISSSSRRRVSKRAKRILNDKSELKKGELCSVRWNNGSVLYRARIEERFPNGSYSVFFPKDGSYDVIERKDIFKN